MATNVVMPKLGMTMSEGTVARWLKQEGEHIDKGAPVLEIETEKIVYQVESPEAGILHIVTEEGTTVPCAGTVGLLASSRVEYQTLLGGAPVPVETPAPAAIAQDGATATAAPAGAGQKAFSSPAARRVAGELGVDISLVPGSGPEGRIVEDDVRKFAEAEKAAAADSERIAVSPVARKLVEEQGLDLGSIRGTGPGGRIVREDVLSAIERQTAPVPTPSVPAPESPAPAASADERKVARTIPLVGLRKAIADRMMLSLQSSAQLSASFDVDATELVKIRQQLLAQVDRVGVRVTFNDLICRACVLALKEHPIFNSTIEGNQIKVYEDINMGIAVNLDDGLIVPVVRYADRMSLIELSKASAALVEKARTRTLKMEEISGGTFTLSNVGAFNVSSFTPIINYPEAAILGAGGIIERPAVVNGQIVARSMMTICLTWDHRINDGVPAVLFAQAVKNLIENPAILLV